MPGSKHISVVHAVGLAAALAGGSPALAACKNAVCVQGSDDGLRRTHIVYLTNQLSGADHYNVIPPGGQQFELHIDHFSFDVEPGNTYTFSVQACKRGFLNKSTCTEWSQFTHFVPGNG